MTAVRVSPHGGLGNQLFALCTAVVAAGGCDVPIEVDTTFFMDTNGLGSCSDQDIRVLRFDGLQLNFSTPGPTLRRLRFHLGGFTSALVNMGLASGLNLPDLATLMRAQNANHVRIRRTREDREIALEAFGLGFPRNIGLQRESEPFMEMSKWVSSTEFLALHVRLGDYMGRSGGLSTCSPNYFQKAVREMRSLSGDRPCLLFSDDPEMAREWTCGIPDVVTVSGTPGLTAPEELLLMARCKGLVLSPSTFSWWAAAISLHADHVICPSSIQRLALDGWVLRDCEGGDEGQHR